MPRSTPSWPLVLTLGLLILTLIALPGTAQPIAIENATVHTLGPDGSLEGATVLIEDGKIAAVGRDLELAADVRRIDAGGKVVTPGLFDSISQIGLVEISQERSSRDDTTSDHGLSAAFDVADAINPRSTLVPINRIEGLTRALVAPGGSHHPIAGLGAIIHLGDRDPLVSRGAVMLVDLGESGGHRAGGSRAAAFLRLREALADARDFAANRDAWQQGARREYALGRLDLEALVPVVEGRRPLAVRVHRASDIEAVLRLAEEERLELVIVGGREAWRVAPAIAAAGVPVVLHPLDNLPGAFESIASRLENAARLHEAGVTVVFTSDDSHNGRNLKQAAGNAVAYGLPWEEGLAAMTRNPARVWGIDEQYGTLEPGKDADIVIWDGDPLEVTTMAERVFIRGQEIPMVSRQTLIRDRYLELDRPWPPAYTRPALED